MAITVHHLNCGHMKPICGSLVFDRGAPQHLVCHCLLLEVGDRLVLVDAGLGRADVADPYARLGRFFVSTVRPVLDERDTAVAQLEARGFDPHAVEHIIVTHLDLDHIGGLSDFPNARVHVMQAEYDQAHARATVHDRQRYRPILWSHGVDWVTHETVGEPWLGLQAVRSLPGLPPEILLVPTVGHSAGHAAVAVQTRDGWLLHCGDAYFHRDEIERPPRCTLGLSFFQWLVAHDRKARLDNRARLAELRRDHADVRLLSAHDALEFEGAASATEG